MLIRSMCHLLPGAALAWVAACSSPDADGVDASELDAGALDAGSVDAGSVDAPDPSTWVRAVAGIDLAIGSDEGVVIAGSFEDTLTFGDQVLVSGGGEDAFIAKLDSGGRPRWALSFGGKSNDVAFAVALDGDDDVYVCGTFKDTVVIDGQALTAGGREAEFLLKLDGATGARVWAVRAGGSLGQRQDLAVTADGATIAVAGGFVDTLDLGGVDLTSVGGLDVAVAVFGDAGQPRWARRFGGASSDRAGAVALVGAGDVVVGGHYDGAVSLGGAPLPDHGGPDFGNDAFLARYAGADGAHVWSSGYGGAADDDVWALAIDANAIYAGGWFRGTTDLGGSALVAAGSSDAFLAKYDATTGAHQWSTRFGGISSEVILGLAVAGDQIGFAGYFGATATVGSSTLTSAGSLDVVYGTAATATGDFLAATGAGGTGVDASNRIALTAQDLWLSGSYAGDVTLFGVTLPPVAGGGFTGRTER